MPNTLVRIAEVRVYPGVPAIPPQPRRCWREVIGYQQVSGLGSAESESKVDYVPYFPPQPDGGGGDSLNADESIGVGIPIYGNYTLDPTVGYSPSYVPPTPIYQTKCSPAQDIPGTPGEPPRTEIDYGPDWRSHARSKAALIGGGYASFTVTGGVTIGFGPNPGSPTGRSLLPAGIAYGFQFIGGEVYEVLGGVVQTPALGTSSVGDEYQVHREPNKVGLKRVRGGATTIMKSRNLSVSGAQFLTAFLYDEQATVDAPSIQVLNPGDSSGADTLPLSASPVTTRLRARPGGEALLPLGTLVATKRNGAWAGTGVAALPLSSVGGLGVVFQDAGEAALPVSAAVAEKVRVGGGVNTQGAAMVINSGNSKAAWMRLEPTAMTVEASGPSSVITPQFSGAELYPADMAMVATILPGTIGGVTASASPMRLFSADYEYSTVELYPAKQRMFATSPIGLPGTYGYADAVAVNSSFATTFSVAVTIEDTLTMETEASFLLLLEDGFEDALNITDETDLQAVLLAAIESGLTFMEIGTPQYTEAVQYAYNAATQAVSRVTGMEFDRIVQAGDTSYGIRKDGVYRIRPGSERISAVIDYGQSMLGSMNKKHIETAYVGMGTDGEVYLKLTPDGGEERVYRVIQRHPTMRANTGRGLTAREWGAKLQVVDATSAELDAVEFVVGVATRRWTR